MGIERPTNRQDSQRDSLERLDLPETVVVTSASAIKINAVQNFLKDILPSRNFNVIGVKAVSGINEQPVGEETELGARNRIDSAESLVPQEMAMLPTVFISIENGIFPAKDGEWEDKAVAVIKLQNNRVVSGISREGVLFPGKAVYATRTKEGGFKDNTVGSAIADIYLSEGKNIDKQDPHSALTDGKFTREQQMKDALKVAFTKALG